MNAEMKTFHKDNPCSSPMPPLSLDNLDGDGGWANLRGPLVKAANVRHTVPFCQHLARKYLQGDSLYSRSCNRVMDSLVEFYNIIYDGGHFLSVDEKTRLAASVETFGIHFMCLRELSRRSGILAWQITPKVHYHMHWPLQAAVENPRMSQNYCEDIMVGRLTTMWAASAHGPYMGRIQASVLVKYWVTLILLLEL